MPTGVTMISEIHIQTGPVPESSEMKTAHTIDNFCMPITQRLL